jgi:hypothetical protein
MCNVCIIVWKRKERVRGGFRGRKRVREKRWKRKEETEEINNQREN